MTLSTTNEIAADFGPEPSKEAKFVARGIYLWAGLSIPWAAAIIAFAYYDGFVLTNGQLPIYLPIAAFLPPLWFLALHASVTGVREWVSCLNASDLTAFQGWRVLGGLFLALWWFGHLPLIFALVAGIGDMAIGLAAPFVAGKLRRKEPGALRAGRWLVILGMLDFVFAIGVGGLSGPGGVLAATPPLSPQLPIAFIPAFLVPNLIILHVLVWLRLKQEH